MDTFRLLARTNPRLIRRWYEYVSELDASAALTVMNYGFDDGRPIALEPAAEGDRYRLQLYHHLALGASVGGKDVIEVGSGRGGGAAYLARAFQPAALRGLDFSPRAVDFCQRHYGESNLSFVAADAQALPLHDESCDVVLNVESSHCYPDFPGFLAEVSRVLRPGGRLAYADFRPRREVAAWRAELASAPNLTVLRAAPITDQVVASLEHDSQAKADLLRRHFPKHLWPLLAAFAAVQGSPVHRSFRARRKEYWSYLLEKARQPAGSFDLASSDRAATGSFATAHAAS
jgi:ubiquinone/menaquinone biosynthesis C-methylase UbiE